MNRIVLSLVALALCVAVASANPPQVRLNVGHCAPAAVYAPPAIQVQQVQSYCAPAVQVQSYAVQSYAVQPVFVQRAFAVQSYGYGVQAFSGYGAQSFGVQRFGVRRSVNVRVGQQRRGLFGGGLFNRRRGVNVNVR